MDFDRQAIERRDFPIARRGYEPAAVDAHLRALAGEIEQLERELSDGGGRTTLAATAGTQVQSILAAAEATAAELERDAADSARTTREQADRDAVRTREEAIAQARTHVAAVAQATAVLLERVGSMDAQVRALIDSVRAGADRLATDLSAVEANMSELYDAAAGQTVTRATAGEPPAQPSVPVPPAEVAGADVHVGPEAPENGDLDGARLIALNMALNGESREDADRYLAENFQLADRAKLIDEVYAAIES